MTETIERLKNYAVRYHQITKKRRLTKSYVLWAVLPGVLLLRAPGLMVDIAGICAAFSGGICHCVYWRLQTDD